MKTTLTTSLTIRLALAATILFAGIEHAAAQTTASNAAVTPALLLSFNGQARNSAATLSWVMEDETNCNGL